MIEKKSNKGKVKGFTDDEKAAMKARAQELKAEARGDQSKADGERDVLAKIAEMSEPDRGTANRLHEIIKTTRQPSRRKLGTGAPPMPKTARSSVTSKACKSSKRGT